MAIDVLANITAFCCISVLVIVYSCVAIIPAWDDGTGFPLATMSLQEEIEKTVTGSPSSLQALPKTHARKWVEKHLRFEWKDNVASLLDTSQQLGRFDVARFRYCQINESSPSSSAENEQMMQWCPCSVTADLSCVGSPSEIESSLRRKAELEAEKMECASMSRLLSKLQHYHRSNAGVDVMLTSLFVDNEIDVEHASVETRHTRWLAFQPRLPLLSLEKFSADPDADPESFLRFVLAERDERWVHDLMMDPQANALKHAPFVFPGLLVMLTCFARLVQALVLHLKESKKEEKDS